jgi:hypothetical protein
MFALLAAVVFSGAAFFSLVVIVQMIRAYLPQMEAALRREPIAHTSIEPVRAYIVRRRRLAPAQAVVPLRFEHGRAVA